MNFQYAHLNVKTNMVFIPNNIPYFVIIFALCELFSTTSCVFTRVVTDTLVKHLILCFNDTCTKKNTSCDPILLVENAETKFGKNQ